jgi:hypothetical protein
MRSAGEAMLRSLSLRKRAAGRAVHVLRASALALTSCVSTGLVHSTNPSFDAAGAESPSWGARVAAGGSLGSEEDWFGADGAFRAETHRDNDAADRIQAYFSGKVPFADYVAQRLERPEIDLDGLRPRVVQAFSLNPVFYTFTWRKTEFSEDTFEGLDSELKWHMLIVPFFTYSWVEHDSRALNDFKHRGGRFYFAWLIEGTDYYRALVSPDVGWIDLALERPMIAAAAGWSIMEDFSGPIADPHRELSTFAGRIAASFAWDMPGSASSSTAAVHL